MKILIQKRCKRCGLKYTKAGDYCSTCEAELKDIKLMKPPTTDKSSIEGEYKITL